MRRVLAVPAVAVMAAGCGCDPPTNPVAGDEAAPASVEQRGFAPTSVEENEIGAQRPEPGSLVLDGSPRDLDQLVDRISTSAGPP